MSLRRLDTLALTLAIGEIAEALGLFGVAYIYLWIQSDPGIDAPLQRAVLIAVYAIIAMTSEALIAPRLKSFWWPVLGLNSIVVILVSLLYWADPASLRFVATLAILTVLFRLLVAAISVRVSTQKLYRFVSALIGSPLLLVAIGLGYGCVDFVYENYYLLPRTKEGFIMPTRWHDFVSLLILASASILFLFVSYRLLKYAFRPKPVPGSAPAALIGN